jgi:hypothetical protein
LAPNFIKQAVLDTKAQITPNKIKEGKFNTPFSSIDRSSRPKKKKNKSNRFFKTK